ncbi:MAG TPA: cell division protein FtsA [Bryobacteraceae bacterium]|nr:cell division protein FtsA [Bryobacteraceae bacterium]
MPDKPRIAVGLDAGSAFTRCVILGVDDGQLRYLGHSEVASIGWNKSRLSDQQALTVCIRSAVRQAEERARVPVDSMVIGIGGGTVNGHNSHGLYELGRPRPLTLEDMTYAVERSELGRLEEDRMILHLFPQDFTLDGRSGKRYPRGSTCSRLEANVHLVTVSEQEHDSLVAAVQEASYKVEETVFEPVAAAYAAISRDDRTRGVAVVDIGMHSTDLVVYDGEAVLLARSLPIAADHFTRDVAVGLTVQYDDAERLKLEYGCAMLGLTSDHSFIEVPSPDDRPPREAPRKQLNEILEARAEELFIYVGSELVTIGMDQKLLEGIMLAGGGAMLNGMCDMAERVLNCPARNALPTGLENFPDELCHPAWATAAGLARYSARLRMKREGRRRAPGLVGLLFR